MYTQEDIQGMLSQYQQSGANLNYMPQNLPSLEEMQAAGAAYQQQQIAQQQAQAEAAALQAQQQAQAEVAALQAQQAQNEALLAQGITPMTNAFDPYSVAENAIQSVRYSANDLGLDVRPENTAGVYMPNRPVGGTETDLNEWSNYYNNTPEAYALMSTDEKSDLLYWNYLSGNISQEQMQEQSKAIREGIGFDDRHISIPGRDSHRWEWQSGGSIGAEEDFFNSPEIQAYADEFGREAAIEKYFKGEGQGLNNAQLWNINQDKVGGFNIKEDLPGGSFFQDEIMGTAGGQMLLGLALGPLAGKLLTGVGGMTAGTLGTQMATGALTSGGMTALGGGDIGDILTAAAGGGLTANIGQLAKAAGLPTSITNILNADNVAGPFSSGVASDIVTQVLTTGKVDIGDALKAGGIDTVIAMAKDGLLDANSTRDIQAMTEEGELQGRDIKIEDALRLENTTDLYGVLGPNGLLSKVGIDVGYMPTDYIGAIMDWVGGTRPRDMIVGPDGEKYPVLQDNDVGSDTYRQDVAVLPNGDRLLAQDVFDGTVSGYGLQTDKTTGLLGDGHFTDVNRYDERYFDITTPRSDWRNWDGIWEKNPFERDTTEYFAWEEFNSDSSGNSLSSSYGTTDENTLHGTTQPAGDIDIFADTTDDSQQTSTEDPVVSDEESLPTTGGGGTSTVSDEESLPTTGGGGTSTVSDEESLPSSGDDDTSTGGGGDELPSTSDTPITDGLLGGGGGDEVNLLKMFKMPWIKRLDPMGPLLSQNAPALQNLSQVYRGPI